MTTKVVTSCDNGQVVNGLRLYLKKSDKCLSSSWLRCHLNVEMSSKARTVTGVYNTYCTFKSQHKTKSNTVLQTRATAFLQIGSPVALLPTATSGGNTTTIMEVTIPETEGFVWCLDTCGNV